MGSQRVRHDWATFTFNCLKLTCVPLYLGQQHERWWRACVRCPFGMSSAGSSAWLVVTFNKCIWEGWVNRRAKSLCPQGWPTPAFASGLRCAADCVVGAGCALRGSRASSFQSWLCTPCLDGFTCRLKLLLNHTNILRPQYQCAEDLAHIWGANKEITAALQDPAILQATCPYSPAGKGSPNFWHFWKLPSSWPVAILLNPGAIVLRVCGGD